MLATASSPSLFSSATNPFHTASPTFGMQTLTNQEKDVLLFMQRLKSSTTQQEPETRSCPPTPTRPAARSPLPPTRSPAASSPASPTTTSSSSSSPTPSSPTSTSTTSSTASSESTREALDTLRRKQRQTRRKPYLCGRCGQPKAGHICPPNLPSTAPVPQQSHHAPTAARRAASPEVAMADVSLPDYVFCNSSSFSPFSLFGAPPSSEPTTTTQARGTRASRRTLFLASQQQQQLRRSSASLPRSPTFPATLPPQVTPRSPPPLPTSPPAQVAGLVREPSLMSLPASLVSQFSSGDLTSTSPPSAQPSPSPPQPTTTAPGCLTSLPSFSSLSFPSLSTLLSLPSFSPLPLASSVSPSQPPLTSSLQLSTSSSSLPPLPPSPLVPSQSQSQPNDGDGPQSLPADFEDDGMDCEAKRGLKRQLGDQEETDDEEDEEEERLVIREEEDEDHAPQPKQKKQKTDKELSAGAEVVRSENEPF